MTSQISSVCLRTFNIIHRVSQIHIPKRDYSRWFSRKPSKMIMPQTSNREENVIDLTEHYEHAQNINHPVDPGSGAFPLPRPETFKKENRTLQDSKVMQPVEKNLFDFDIIDAQTKGLNVKRIMKKKKEETKNNEPKKENEYVSIEVFDPKGNFVYEKLPFKDSIVGNRIIKLKNRKNRAHMGQFLSEGWRLIGDGLLAGCQLDTLIFSRLEDLENLRPYIPKKGVKIYKMPYKEMQMWSNMETCPGIMGIFEMPKVSLKSSNEVYPINVICDNIRDPGNLGSILRACLGVGCNSVLLTRGCVDIWERKVLQSAAGAHFRMAIRTNIDWDQIENIIDFGSTVLLADNNTNEQLVVKQENSKKNRKYSNNDDESESDEEEKLEKLSSTIPITNYFKLKYHEMDSTTLIIGGETQGISEECYRFAIKRSGIRVNIPLAAGVDSLNSGMALGIIAFEIKKQLLEAGYDPKQVNENRAHQSI